VTGTTAHSAEPADRFRTRGQPAAVAAIAAMLAGGIPHALLLAGPAGVGKQTLADDVAAALLCRAGPGIARPCRECRGCRALDHGNHPDLHRLEPTGAGQVIPIGGRDERGVRDLVRELALLPVEGGARVAVIADADRMTEDAQSAFLKTLEEPPAGTVLLLTASDEERLLPTIRSRLVRIRVGPVPRPEIEALLVEQGLADAPLAARLARLAAGRSGEAVALARAPEAITIRSEIARTLLDLIGANRADRLRLGRDLLARAAVLLTAVRAGAGAPRADDAPRGRRSTGRDDRRARALDRWRRGARPGVGTTSCRDHTAGRLARRCPRPRPGGHRRSKHCPRGRPARRARGRVVAPPGIVRAPPAAPPRRRRGASRGQRQPGAGRRRAHPGLDRVTATGGAADERATSEHRLEATVHGRVQGVGFRVFVLRIARELQLRGWVANEPGGRVLVVAEGSTPDLNRLVQELRVGPPAALVERVDEQWSAATGQPAGFEIRSGWHGGD
jgi:DNA polymerase III delta' subunit